MSLLEQQNLMARLYMDANLRRAFLSDPSGVAGPFGLSSGEIAEIALVVPEEIGSFADSLLRKRMHEVGKMLPLTRSALRESFGPHFIKYVGKTPGSSEMNRREDVLEFCRYLERGGPGPVRDAARFELARIEFYSGKRNFVIRRFDHDIRNGRLTPRRTYSLWIRIGKHIVHRVY
jgi:hypothetical protein